MPFFVCGRCSAGLKKSQVEAHMNSCRPNFVSCIDCSKDFSKSEFKAHTSCITESQKYESKSYVEKPNKGDVKQQSWMEKVQKAVQEFRGSARAKSLLEGLADYPNLPRKKIKFVNFIKNSFRSVPYNDSMIEEVWSVFENITKQQQQQQQAPKPSPAPVIQNDGSEENHQRGGVKRKAEDDGAEISEEALFDWCEQIKKQCQKSIEPISVKKLEKKIFKKFKQVNEEQTDEEETRQKFLKKLLKKLRKNTSDFSLINENPNKDEIFNNDDDYYSKLFVKYVC